MHGAGFTHRDLYLCHLFLRPDGGLTLIDLQRVTRGGPGHRRRAVKDLAALNYSAPSPAVTRADRMRFLLAYLGRRRLGAAGGRLARRIVRKTERIRRHDANKRAREARAAEER
jgi:membrane-associated phospholipid phosphatase